MQTQTFLNRSGGEGPQQNLEGTLQVARWLVTMFKVHNFILLKSQLPMQLNHPLTKQTFYDLTSLTNAPSPKPLSLTPLPPHHPHTKVLYFDTNEETDEFRKAAYAIRLKYYPDELDMMHRKPSYVTRDNLQSFQSMLANEIAKIKIGVAIKRCHVCTNRTMFLSHVRTAEAV